MCSEREKEKDNFCFNSFLKITCFPFSLLPPDKRDIFHQIIKRSRRVINLPTVEFLSLHPICHLTAFFFVFYLNRMPPSHTSQHSTWMFQCHFRLESWFVHFSFCFFNANLNFIPRKGNIFPFFTSWQGKKENIFVLLFLFTFASLG